MSTLELDLPLPPQRAADTLREQILEHLKKQQPEVGAWLCSESQLMKQAQLSRSTVRRAMDPLERDGWIERRQGKGTFVGPRVVFADAKKLPGGPMHVTDTELIRMAIISARSMNRSIDWYTSGLVGSLDAVAVDANMTVELMSFRGDDIQGFYRRLRQSSPDVVALITPGMNLAPIVGATMQLGIPTVGTGLGTHEFGLPAVTNDDEGGAVLAVKTLIKTGRKRIGLLLSENTPSYTMFRRRGYERAIREVGLELDRNLELWLPYELFLDKCGIEPQAEMILKWIKKYKIDGIVSSQGGNTAAIGHLMCTGKLNVPNDVSLITFDQVYGRYIDWLNGLRPTVVELPLEAIGAELARMANIAARGDASSLDPLTLLPCTISEGMTTPVV